MKVVNVYNDKNFTVYIGRPSQGADWKFGNPFVIGRDGNRLDCLQKCRDWLKTGEDFDCKDATKERRTWILKHLKDLKQDDILGCFCYPAYCHGDVLIELCSGNPVK